jgi:hypothetical protein
LASSVAGAATLLSIVARYPHPTIRASCGAIGAVRLPSTWPTGESGAYQDPCFTSPAFSVLQWLGTGKPMGMITTATIDGTAGLAAPWSFGIAHRM